MGRRVYSEDPLLVPGCVGWEASAFIFCSSCRSTREAKDNPLLLREMPVFWQEIEKRHWFEVSPGAFQGHCLPATQLILSLPLFLRGRLEQRPSRPVSMVGPSFEEVARLMGEGWSHEVWRSTSKSEVLRLNGRGHRHRELSLISEHPAGIPGASSPGPPARRTLSDLEHLAELLDPRLQLFLSRDSFPQSQPGCPLSGQGFCR